MTTKPQSNKGRPARPAPAGGFTLIEAVVGVAVTAMVLGSAFALVGQSFLVVENARDFTRASQILQSEIEDLRTLNWNDLGDLPASAEFDPDSKFDAAFSDRYTCTREVADRKADQKSITLSIAWTDRRGRPHERRYITFFTKEGLNDYYYRSL